MFINRFDAGNRLAHVLEKYDNNPNVVIFAVPRGGIEVGYTIARELHVPLDAIFTKKIGHPTNPEFAIGAVSMKHIYIAPDFLHNDWIQGYVELEASKIRQILKKRIEMYRDDKPAINLTDKIVILVDDGVATGATLIASLALIRLENPRQIIVALPVAPAQAVEHLRTMADEVICLKIPDVFLSVGQFYQEFAQTSDEDAKRLLREANI